MSKIILLTGATDGIGLVTAEKLVAQGHHLLIHGRNAEKLNLIEEKLRGLNSGRVHSFQADFSDLTEVETLAKNIKENFSHLDIIINNAGVYKTASPITKGNLDLRFVVNTFSPYLLTKLLMPLMNNLGRVINLSSAAQESVNIDEMTGKLQVNSQFSAYGQSKLALTMWSRHMALTLGDKGPNIIAVNPGSLLASKMVKEGFGVEGKDLNVGADILIRAGLTDEFANASGKYFDNDIGEFSEPHTDALDDSICAVVVEAIENQLSKH